jgi:hypothetical protein
VPNNQHLQEGDEVQCPLFYQYRVRPTQANELKGKLAGAIATVILFAESDDMGRARSGRFIARNHWEIEKVMRVMAMCPQHIANFAPTLKKVYLRAERFGIAASFDGWSKHPHI